MAESARLSTLLDPETVRIAVAPIGWTNDDLPELGGDIPFERCIDEMAEAGFAGCEVGSKFPRDPDELLKALAPRGLDVVGAWFSLHLSEDGRAPQCLDALGRHLDFLSAVRARVAVVCDCGRSVQGQPVDVMANRPVFDESEWDRLCRGLDAAGELANRRGLDLVYHHHIGTGIQSAEEVDRLMLCTDPEKVSLLIDTGHLTFAGDDPVELLRRHAARVRHVHLKDLRAEVFERVLLEGRSFLDAVRQGVFTVPGDGMIDFTPFLEALAEIGYRGWLVVEAEQDPAKATPLVYARRGRRYVKARTGC